METKMSESPLGRFCWFDLMTPDPESAPDFYGAVTGWTTTPFDGAGEPYTMFVNGEQPMGGVMALPAEAIAAGAPPHWLAYVSTPDVKATAAKAAELGGTVMAEMDIPTVGSFAIIADPQGAVFAAFQPLESAPGHDGAPQVGEFSWHELYTHDWEAAWSFYSALFGWHKTDQMDMGESGIYQMYGRGEQTLGGMMNRMPDMPAPHWLCYIRVADMDVAAAAVAAAGGKVWNGPMEVPGGDFVAHCFDAQGAAFALHSSTHS
jgi:predicted enzyme related to lactoylglutathione lyase